MKMLPVIELHLRHEYYRDARCADFSVEPTPATQRWLARYRCTLKPMTHGFRLFTVADDAGVPIVAWSTDVVVQFHLRLHNPDFLLFTNLATIAQTATHIDTNVDGGPGGQVTITLRSRDATAHLPPDVFATIAVHCPAPTRGASPVVCQIQFLAKRVHWIYYLVTDVASERLHIADNASDPIGFGDTSRTDLCAHPDPADPIAVMVAARYPAKHLARFRSETAVPCQQAARTAIQLLMDTHVVISALPNPALRHHTIDVQPGAQPGDCALFHIVPFFTQATSISGG